MTVIIPSVMWTEALWLPTGTLLIIQVPQFRSIFPQCHLHYWQSVKSISGSHLSWGNRALLIGPAAESCQSLTGRGQGVGVGVVGWWGVRMGRKEITETSCRSTTTIGSPRWRDVSRFWNDFIFVGKAWNSFEDKSEKSMLIETPQQEAFFSWTMFMVADELAAGDAHWRVWSSTLHMVVLSNYMDVIPLRVGLIYNVRLVLAFYQTTPTV